MTHSNPPNLFEDFNMTDAHCHILDFYLKEYGRYLLNNEHTRNDFLSNAKTNYEAIGYEDSMINIMR